MSQEAFVVVQERDDGVHRDRWVWVPFVNVQEGEETVLANQLKWEVVWVGQLNRCESRKPCAMIYQTLGVGGEAEFHCVLQADLKLVATFLPEHFEF